VQDNNNKSFRVGFGKEREKVLCNSFKRGKEDNHRTDSERLTVCEIEQLFRFPFLLEVRVFCTRFAFGCAQQALRVTAYKSLFVFRTIKTTPGPQPADIFVDGGGQNDCNLLLYYFRKKQNDCSLFLYLTIKRVFF